MGRHHDPNSKAVHRLAYRRGRRGRAEGAPALSTSRNGIMVPSTLAGTAIGLLISSMRQPFVSHFDARYEIIVATAPVFVGLFVGAISAIVIEKANAETTAHYKVASYIILMVAALILLLVPAVH